MLLAGESKLPYGQVPIMFYNGEVTLQTSSGKVSALVLDTHNFDEKLQDQTAEQVRAVSGHVKATEFLSLSCETGDRN